LHVDAAYAGPAAIVPEFRWLLDGCDRADTLVLNPHKWLFVPIDLSVLYARDLEMVRRAFTLSADYLETPEVGVRNYMDYGLQLGRRFRALKLWFVLRRYGAEAIRNILRRHIALAQELAGWIEAEPGWTMAAPHPLSVVCFRYALDGVGDEELDRGNLAVMEAVNASGEAFISSTKLDGRVVLRVAIGNERTTRDDVRAVWELLRTTAVEVFPGATR
jgi:aromatic-L-amino-acid decarboxylase